MCTVAHLCSLQSGGVVVGQVLAVFGAQLCPRLALLNINPLMLLPVLSLSLERVRSERTACSLLMSERRSPLEVEVGSSVHCTVAFYVVGTEERDMCYQGVRAGLFIKCHCWLLTGKKGMGNASPSLLELRTCVLMSST